MKALPEDLALLRRCGVALWGLDWRPQLRREFGINPHTVRRWMSGEAIVPRTLWVALAQLMHERAAAIEGLAGEIDASLAGEPAERV